MGAAPDPPPERPQDGASPPDGRQGQQPASGGGAAASGGSGGHRRPTLPSLPGTRLLLALLPASAVALTHAVCYLRPVRPAAPAPWQHTPPPSSDVQASWPAHGPVGPRYLWSRLSLPTSSSTRWVVRQTTCIPVGHVWPLLGLLHPSCRSRTLLAMPCTPHAAAAPPCHAMQISQELLIDPVLLVETGQVSGSKSTLLQLASKAWLLCGAAAGPLPEGSNCFR